MQKWNHFWSSIEGRAGSRTSTGQLSAAELSRAELKLRLGSGWRRLWREEEGQTLVEYGLLIGLLALVVIIAVTFFGRRMSNNLYGTSNNVLPFNN